MCTSPRPPDSPLPTGPPEAGPAALAAVPVALPRLPIETSDHELIDINAELLGHCEALCQIMVEDFQGSGAAEQVRSNRRMRIMRALGSLANAADELTLALARSGAQGGE